jgi:hypothetical protein
MPHLRRANADDSSDDEYTGEKSIKGDPQPLAADQLDFGHPAKQPQPPQQQQPQQQQPHEQQQPPTLDDDVVVVTVPVPPAPSASATLLLVIQRLLNPLFLSIFTGLIVGLIPAIKDRLHPPSGETSSVSRAIDTVGAAHIPISMLLIGTLLSRGPRGPLTQRDIDAAAQKAGGDRRSGSKDIRAPPPVIADNHSSSKAGPRRLARQQQPQSQWAAKSGDAAVAPAPKHHPKSAALPTRVIATIVIMRLFVMPGINFTAAWLLWRAGVFDTGVAYFIAAVIAVTPTASMVLVLHQAHDFNVTALAPVYFYEYAIGVVTLTVFCMMAMVIVDS